MNCKHCKSQTSLKNIITYTTGSSCINRNISNIYSLYKYLYIGYSELDYYNGKAILTYPLKLHNSKFYKENSIIYWKNLVTMRRIKDNEIINIENEKEDIHSENITIIAELIQCKSLSILTYLDQSQILIWPYTNFIVTKCMDNRLIYLRELPTIRYTKILLWVDDNHNSNYSYIKSIEKNKVSVLTCNTTVEALELIKANLWMLNSGKSNFKIITDMKRIENKIEIKTAGLIFINKLRESFKYEEEVFVFTGSKEKVLKQFNDMNFNHQEGKVIVGSELRELNDYLKDFKYK